MQYVISFIEGILTFISPCLLPMLPVYLTYFAGGSQNSRKTLINALTPAPSKSIHITMDDGVAVIDVFVSLKYGANIPEVAANIQSNIKNNVQNMTGIAVSKVNVHIADIDLSEAQGE